MTADAKLVEALNTTLAILDKATPGWWHWSANGNIIPTEYVQDCEIAAVYSDRDDDSAPANAQAIITAVNFLREHGRQAAAALTEGGRIVGSRQIDGVHVIVANAFTPGVEQQLLVRHDHYLAALAEAQGENAGLRSALAAAILSNEPLNRMKGRAQRAESELAALRESSAPCLWLEDPIDGSWDTACGNKHHFMHGDTADNLHAFCPYCGGRLVEPNEPAIDAQATNEVNP